MPKKSNKKKIVKKVLYLKKPSKKSRRPVRKSQKISKKKVGKPKKISKRKTKKSSKNRKKRKVLKGGAEYSCDTNNCEKKIIFNISEYNQIMKNGLIICDECEIIQCNNCSTYFSKKRRFLEILIKKPYSFSLKLLCDNCKCINSACHNQKIQNSNHCNLHKKIYSTI